MKFFENTGIYCLASELLEKIGVPHAFTSCRGGVSDGVFSALNVSTRRKDSEGKTDKYENTVENFRRVTAIVGAKPENSVCAHQVHGNRILELDNSFCGMGILKGSAKNVDADGLYLSPKAADIGAICVKSADCTPILLADRKSGSVCAVHSGWRGTVSDIVGNAVMTMVKNGSSLSDIYAAVGPCIGVCCYEVSEDVYLQAEKTLELKGVKEHISEFFIDKRETENGTKYNFNIGGMCAHLALLAGVPEENIDFADICTCCSADEKGRIFFSHRGQKGYSGTFASVIAPFRARNK